MKGPGAFQLARVNGVGKGIIFMLHPNVPDAANFRRKAPTCPCMPPPQHRWRPVADGGLAQTQHATSRAAVSCCAQACTAPPARLIVKAAISRLTMRRSVLPLALCLALGCVLAPFAAAEEKMKITILVGWLVVDERVPNDAAGGVWQLLGSDGGGCDRDAAHVCGLRRRRPLPGPHAARAFVPLPQKKAENCAVTAEKGDQVEVHYLVSDRGSGRELR